MRVKINKHSDRFYWVIEYEDGRTVEGYAENFKLAVKEIRDQVEDQVD